MRDKRPVDELSIEELERILAIRKREERQKQLERMKRSGRVIPNTNAPLPDLPPTLEPTPAAPDEAPAALPPATVTVPPSAVKTNRQLAPRFEDDPGDIGLNKQTNKDTAWRNFVNRALLFVEVAAVVGLVYIGTNLVTAIGKLEQETAQAQAAAEEVRRAGIPTPVPTPKLRVEEIVLPGGHKPFQTQFNFDEIPAHLLPQVQSQVLAPVISRPPPTDETPLFLIIPKLNINQAIVAGLDSEALKQGVGMLLNGVTPNRERGNLVFAGHNDIYNEVFRHIDELQEGDEIQVQTTRRVYIYTVTGFRIVAPTAVEVMESGTTATLTLISCYPYGRNDKRIAVFAQREDL
jgi:sortase A